MGEISNFLMGENMYEELDTFLAEMHPSEALELATLDAVLVANITVALELRGDFDVAIKLLSDKTELGCFPTLASERANLMELWFRAVELRANATTPLERWRARTDTPVPRNIGCPYNVAPGYNGCTYW